MSREPLLSWRKRTPSSPDEQATADLIRQAGEPKALSPEALSRIHRRLRDRPKERLPLFADMRPALGGAGLAALAIVAALSYTSLARKEGTALSAGQVALEPKTGAKGESSPVGPHLPGDALALGNQPPPPDLIPALSAADGQGGAVAPQGGAAPGERRFAQPPPFQQGELAAAQQRAPGHAVEREEQVQAYGAAVAVAGASAGADDLSDKPFAQAQAARAAQLSPRAVPAGGPVAPAAPAASRKASEKKEAKPVESAEPIDTCFAQYPLPGPEDSAALQRALFNRGSCRLRIHNRELGLSDLRTYLRLFSAGEHADEARKLIRANSPLD